MKKYCDNCGDMMECSCGLSKTKTPADLKLYSQSDLDRARREGFEAGAHGVLHNWWKAYKHGIDCETMREDIMREYDRSLKDG